MIISEIQGASAPLQPRENNISQEDVLAEGRLKDAWERAAIGKFKVGCFTGFAGVGFTTMTMLQVFYFIPRCQDHKTCHGIMDSFAVLYAVMAIVCLCKAILVCRSLG